MIGVIVNTNQMLINKFKFRDSTLKSSLLKFLYNNNEELFTTNEMLDIFRMEKKNTIRNTILNLYSIEAIQRIKLGNSFYYGHPEIVENLRDEINGI